MMTNGDLVHLKRLVIMLCVYGKIVGLDNQTSGLDTGLQSTHSTAISLESIEYTTFQQNLKELEAYLDTDNVTEVYLQRYIFCNKLNHLLELPKEDIRKEGATAIRAVRAIDEFSTKIGEYLHHTSRTSTHVPRSGFAWATNLQQNQSVTVVATSSLQNLNLKFQKTNGTDFRVAEKITGDPHFRCSASLNTAAFLGPSDKVIHATVFREPTIFVDKDSSVIASSVFSLAIDDFTSKNLSSPVKLIFKKLRNMHGRFSCVYFEFGRDDSLGGWRTSGCRKIKETKDTVHCECSHLTNFALLLDISHSEINFFYLEVITWCGCSVSLVGLLITVILYSFVTKLQRRLGSRIVVRLCISLTLLIAVFLAFAENRNNDEGDYGCMITSIFIHYFLLVTFMWMATEALSMYLLFVKPMQAFDQRLFLKRSTAASLAIPAAIVTITAVSKPGNLLDDKFCLVRSHSFYMGVLAPITLILIFNSIVVVCSILSLSQPSLASKKMSIWQQCKITITMSILLGVTWFFALFAVGKATVPFQVIFTLLTSLQGFFVFALFVLMKKDARDVLRNSVTRYRYVKCCGCFGSCLGKGGKKDNISSCKTSSQQTAMFHQSNEKVLLHRPFQFRIEVHRPLCQESSVEFDMTPQGCQLHF